MIHQSMVSTQLGTATKVSSFVTTALTLENSRTRVERVEPERRRSFDDAPDTFRSNFLDARRGEYPSHLKYSRLGRFATEMELL